MVAKLSLGVAGAVGALLVGLSWHHGAVEIDSLRRSAAGSAERLAGVVAGSVEHSMLLGNGIAVKEMIRGLRERLPGAEVRVFDPWGAPVFGPTPPAPLPGSLPAPVREALSTGTRRTAPGPRVYRPMPNEARCHPCHDASREVRGVLELVPAPGWEARPSAALPDGAHERALSAVVHSGFVHVMTARQAARLDDYFAELVEATPGLTGVAVHDATGAVRFGRRVDALPRAETEASLVPGAAFRLVETREGRVALVPLPAERRCQACHEDRAAVRGVLAVGFAPGRLSAGAGEALEASVDASVRTIMVSSLGRLAFAFLREVVGTGAATEAALWDDSGRRAFTSVDGVPPEEVREPLARGVRRLAVTAGPDDERVLVAEPMRNGPDCARCHGADPPIRGVVTVSLPTGARAAREESIRRTLAFAGAVLVLTVVTLALLLHVLVLRPVREIGGAAEAVGRGDLSASVRSAREEGDEVQRLGSRINEMVVGLRTREVLTRYVSRATAEAAHGAARLPSLASVAPSGERRPMAVLFSDVRGFTAFSERVAPEAVVELVNRYLAAQAEVVGAHGGDVDKFVGDELMAVFDGPDAAGRAVLCALSLVDAVDRARRGGDEPRVGAGVAFGEVVAGSVGSPARMDFTVMGDVVNTAARLVGAASAGEVLVTEAVRDACSAGPACPSFVPLPPLVVKGKREPLTVFRALGPALYSRK